MLQNVMSITWCSLTKTMNISLVAWFSLLILNESVTWHSEYDMRVLESNAILWLTSIFMIFFWMWTLLPNATISVTNNQSVGGSITWLVAFCLAPNSRSLTWSRHFLSVIITTFLEYTLAVWSQAAKWAFLLALSSLRILRKHAHFVAYRKKDNVCTPLAKSNMMERKYQMDTTRMMNIVPHSE